MIHPVNIVVWNFRIWLSSLPCVIPLSFLCHSCVVSVSFLCHSYQLTAWHRVHKAACTHTLSIDRRRCRGMLGTWIANPMIIIPEYCGHVGESVDLHYNATTVDNILSLSLSLSLSISLPLFFSLSPSAQSRFPQSIKSDNILNPLRCLWRRQP